MKKEKLVERGWWGLKRCDEMGWYFCEIRAHKPFLFALKKIKTLGETKSKIVKVKVVEE